MTPDEPTKGGRAAQLERVAWTIAEWGKRYGYSKSHAYRIVQSGQGPRTVKLAGNAHQRITVEADAEWRRSLVERAA